MKKALTNAREGIKKWYAGSGTNPMKEQYYDTKSSPQWTYALGGVCAAVIFVVYYLVSFFFCLDPGLQDIKSHTDFALDFYLKKENFIEAWTRMPYMFWHFFVKILVSKFNFPEADAASITNAAFGVFCFAATAWFLYRVIRYYTGRNNLAMALVGSIALSFAGPLHCMFFGDAYTGGAFSSNPMHNPTHMAVKGFGILLFMAGVDIIRSYKELEPIFFCKKGLYFKFGLFLFLSTLTKPTFMYMLLPAGFLFIVADLIASAVKRDKYTGKIWGACWRIAIACIPSLIYLALEYFAFYFWGDATNSSKLVFTTPFLVWKFYSLSIRKSVLLGMCFPIWMVITNPGYFIKTTEGRLSLIGYAVGVLEFSFIAESGDRMDAGNFSWCMMAGMGLLFATSVVRLIMKSMERKESFKHALYVMASWFLLALHVYSWLYYYGVFREIL